MHSLHTRGVGRPASWLDLNVAAGEVLLAVTVLFGSLSLLAMASGDPETMALVALAGLSIGLIGLTALRLSEHLRTTRHPSH